MTPHPVPLARLARLVRLVPQIVNPIKLEFTNSEDLVLREDAEEAIDTTIEAYMNDFRIDKCLIYYYIIVIKCICL